MGVGKINKSSDIHNAAATLIKSSYPNFNKLRCCNFSRLNIFKYKNSPLPYKLFVLLLCLIEPWDILEKGCFFRTSSEDPNWTYHLVRIQL